MEDKKEEEKERSTSASLLSQNSCLNPNPYRWVRKKILSFLCAPESKLQDLHGYQWGLSMGYHGLQWGSHFQEV